MLIKLTKKPLYYYLTLLFFLIVAPETGFANDLLQARTDSILKDTIVKDTVKVRAAGELKSKVMYSARDSIRFDVKEKKVYLYGDAKISYETMNLTAGYVIIDWNSHNVYSEGLKDSTGKITGTPEFTDGSENFKAQAIKYNFNTKKGKISSVVTKEGEGYIHGETVKKQANDEYFIKNGIYTTCELDTPHFFIASNRLKVIPNDKVVTGPAYLIIEKIPTPFAVPFGYFPNKKGRASGIIIPAYGESDNLGFFFKN